MLWPEKMKAGGTFWKLIVCVRKIVDMTSNSYLSGECRESEKAIEISKGEDDIDIFLHETTHVGQYTMGRYCSEDVGREEDEGWEDLSAQFIRMFMLDNPLLILRLLKEIVIRAYGKVRWEEIVGIFLEEE
jgi:hypothetical protein